MKKTTTRYRSVEHIVASLAKLLRPPKRRTVAECAGKYRYLNNAGAYVGPWLNTKAPYLIEPMNELDSREFEGVVFIGPAQSGKTDALILNWVTFSVKADPMDMIIYSPTNASARDFSMRRIDRLHRHSKKVGAALLKNRDADNVFDKHYSNGMLLTLGWPTVDQLSGKPVPRVALTDYDRMDDDIGGDGSPYDLAVKRTTTFGSFKMALAESSPSKPIEDLRWIPSSPHEAPPAKGILALYNRGDRRRWYWPCPHCSGYFEGRFTHLEWDDLNDPLASAETVRMRCPHCGHAISPDDRHEMQQWGMWVRDGEGVDAKGRRFGRPRRTSIASFWLNGVAAAFTTWKRLVETYLAAEEEYRTTGSEEALKKFYNTDLGEPYIPKAADTDRLPEHLRSRAEVLPVLDGDESDKDLIDRIAGAPKGDVRHLVPMVPAGVRFLVANVDVQKNMFVVQVHGICPGNPFDIVVIDRFRIRKSKRKDPSGEREWVKPATYLEDWDLLIEQVMDRTYELADGSGRRMAVKMTTCDSGGYAKGKGESTTTMAYNFYRRLVRDNLHGRFHLTKGDHSPGVPRARINYPDASHKDKFSAARGDVPVLLFNSNVLKDGLHSRLDCIEPGKGMVMFPDWLPDWWFQELCSERRTTKGWELAPHSRNEGWDLLYYCIGVCVSQLLLVEGINWDNPPRWAADWDINDMVSQPGEAKRFAQANDAAYDFGNFAKMIA